MSEEGRQQTNNGTDLGQEGGVVLERTSDHLLCGVQVCQELTKLHGYKRKVWGRLE